MNLRKYFVFCFSILFLESLSSQTFTHPGILITNESIIRMKRIIANKEYPGYASYNLLKENTLSSNTYTMKGPYEYISRDDVTYKYTKTGMENDFSAAYLNALMYTITNTPAYAEKARQILISYANTLKGIPESNDAPLLAGLEGYKIISATELLKYTYPGFTADDFTKVKAMLTNYFIPILDTFSKKPPYTNGNWGIIYVKGYMSAAILLDDRAMYEKAKTFYLSANDNGTIANYIDGTTGQLQESGRDQGHCILGIGNMGTVCEMAWQQGDDLYGALNNRFLKGSEYVSRYNLGYDVPFRRWTDITGKYNNWTTISSISRGRFSSIFEMIYNHYVYRKGLSMPFTFEVLKRIRPEGFDAAQPSYGSLLFYESTPLSDTWETGLVDECFYTNSYHSWNSATTGATLSIVNNQLKVDMTKQSDGSYRGDIQRTNGRTVHGGNYPVLALKIQGANGINIAFDTNKGPFGNGYGKWTGIIAPDIYYCDMTSQPFGGTNTLGKSDTWNLTTFKFKVAGITSGTSFTIDWIKTFPSVDSLTKFIANPYPLLTTKNSTINTYDIQYRLCGQNIYLVNMTGSCTVSLYDLTGRLECFCENVNRNEFQISPKSSGMKILRINTSKGDKAFKIFVP